MKSPQITCHNCGGFPQLILSYEDNAKSKIFLVNCPETQILIMKRKLGCKMFNMTIKWKVYWTKLNLDSYYTLYYFSLYIYFQIVQNVICHAVDVHYIWPQEKVWMRPKWGALWIYFIAILCLQSLSWLAAVATVLNCTAVPQSVVVLITQMWAAARQFLTNEGACFPVRVPYVWYVGPFPLTLPRLCMNHWHIHIRIRCVKLKLLT